MSRVTSEKALFSEVQDLKVQEAITTQCSDEKRQIATELLKKQDPKMLAMMKLSQLMGGWRMARAFEQIGRGAHVSIMAELLEGNEYKELPFEHGGEVRTAANKDEFCKLVFGCSKSQASEMLSDFRTCGNDESRYEAFMALGLHRDQRRLLRKIPEDIREDLITTAIEQGDKDEVLDLIEAQTLRHANEKAALAQEKEDLSKQLERSKSEQEANQRLLLDKDQKINSLDRELRRDLSQDEEKQRRTQKDNEQQDHLKQKSFACLASLNELSKAVDEVLLREDRSEYLEEVVYADLRGVFRHALLIGRDFGIDPVQLLGFPIDPAVLDQTS
ncbi:MAG: hypothetical protein ACKVJE_20205 [Pseudomonadales bacterium]